MDGAGSQGRWKNASMNQVTCDFPEYDLASAVTAVKEDAPDNQVLRVVSCLARLVGS